MALEPGHANAYDMHRTLSRAFAHSADASPERFLWRIEPAESHYGQGSATVLVQSATPGNWQALGQPGGYARIFPEKAVDLARLLGARRRYLFRLLCNPTVTREGKRYGLLREHEQLAWLARQAQIHGFEIVAAELGRSERVAFRRGAARRRVTLQAVQFDGILVAIDTAALAAALNNGIGHAKAFGLGLLSLAPVSGT